MTTPLFTLVAYRPNTAKAACGRGCCGYERTDSDFRFFSHATETEVRKELTDLLLCDDWEEWQVQLGVEGFFRTPQGEWDRSFAREDGGLACTEVCNHPGMPDCPPAAKELQRTMELGDQILRETWDERQGVAAARYAEEQAQALRNAQARQAEMKRQEAWQDEKDRQEFARLKEKFKSSTKP